MKPPNPGEANEPSPCQTIPEFAQRLRLAQRQSGESLRARAACRHLCGRHRVDRAVSGRPRSAGQADRDRFRRLLHRFRVRTRGPSRARLRCRGSLGCSASAVRPQAGLHSLLLPAPCAPDLFAARARALLRLAYGMADCIRPRVLPCAARLSSVARRRDVLGLSRRVSERRPRTKRLLERGARRRGSP